MSELEHHGADRGQGREGARGPARRKARIEGSALEITAKVGEEGKLFGSVTAAQIAELLAARGVEIDRRKIELAEPIKDGGRAPRDVQAPPRRERDADA